MSYFLDNQRISMFPDDKCITQSNYHFSFGISVGFMSWANEFSFAALDSIVALWRVKALKPKPVATTTPVPAVLNTFSVN